KLVVLLSGQRREIRDVRARHHHQVPVVVGKPVEDREGVRGPAEDQVLAIVAGSRQLAEDASALPLSLLDRLHPPGGPELIHHLTRLAARNMSAPWRGAADPTPSVAPWNAPWNAPRTRPRSASSRSRGGYCAFG